MVANLKDPNDDMVANVEVRTMHYADLKAVFAVEQRAYPHPWTLGIFRDCLRVGYNAWVMVHELQVIGYGIVMMSAGEAHILNICIDPDYQGRGLGRHLLRHLVHSSSRTDIEMVLLEVRRSNVKAKLLYQSEGFHELGVRKAYYPSDEGREDAIILARYITPAGHHTDAGRND